MKSSRDSQQQLDEIDILEHVRNRPHRSRADVARDLGMSAATASRVVRRLLHSGALREVGQGKSIVGRRPTLLEYNAEQGFVVAVDMGGTSCRCALTDMQGEIVSSSVVPVHQPDKDTFDVLCECIESMLLRSGDLPSPVKALCVGVSGVVSRSGEVSRAPNVGWENMPLGRCIQERFGIPVVVENDVNLAALGELWRGAAQGLTNYAVISIGTGIGAGIVAAGNLLRGHHHAAGEVGYIVPGTQYLASSFEPDGCLEALASGPAIERTTIEILARDTRPSPLRDLHPPAAADVFARYKVGDVVARDVLDEVGDQIALLIINMAAVLDPEIVILGGSVGLALEEFLPRIRGQIEKYVATSLQVEVSSLGGRATLFGAISAALTLARNQPVVGIPESGQSIALRV